MQTVRAYYDGRSFVPEKPLKIAKNQTVILSFSEDTQSDTSQKPHRLTLQAKRERDVRELALLNENAEQMNAEAADVLLYQEDIFKEDPFAGDL